MRFVFRETHTRKAHMPSEEAVYRCPECDINFVTQKGFSIHKKNAHANDGKCIKYECRIPNCGFQTEKREELAVHVHSDHPNQVKGLWRIFPLLVFCRSTCATIVAATLWTRRSWATTWPATQRTERSRKRPDQIMTVPTALGNNWLWINEGWWNYCNAGSSIERGTRSFMYYSNILKVGS